MSDQVSTVADLRAVEVSLDGTGGPRSITVSPLRAREYPAFIRAGGDAVLPLFVNTPADAGAWLLMLGAQGEALIRMAAVASRQGEDEIGDLLPDELIRLLVAIVEVNLDFFVQRMGPALAGAQAQLVRLKAAIASSSSSTTSSPS